MRALSGRDRVGAPQRRPADDRQRRRFASSRPGAPRRACVPTRSGSRAGPSCPCSSSRTRRSRSATPSSAPTTGLRMWCNEPLDERRLRFYAERFAPTLEPMLAEPFDHVLVTHGPAVVSGGRRCARGRRRPAALVPPRLGPDLGEVDHGDRVVLGHLAVVELAQEVRELVDVADLGVVVLDLARRDLAQRLDLDLVDRPRRTPSRARRSAGRRARRRPAPSCTCRSCRRGGSSRSCGGGAAGRRRRASRS